MVVWQSPPTTDMNTTAPLTGAELKAKVAELGPTPENELAIACGYINAAGRANIAQFKAALLEAHGILQPPAETTKRGRGLGFEVTVGTKGQIVLSGGYSELIGLAPSQKAAVQHVGNALVLCAAGVVPLFRDEPAPQVGPTYDGAEGI
jgi:hypothetical protein